MLQTIPFADKCSNRESIMKELIFAFVTLYGPFLILYIALYFAESEQLRKLDTKNLPN